MRNEAGVRIEYARVLNLALEMGKSIAGCLGLSWMRRVGLARELQRLVMFIQCVPGVRGREWGCGGAVY